MSCIEPVYEPMKQEMTQDDMDKLLLLLKNTINENRYKYIRCKSDFDDKFIKLSDKKYKSLTQKYNRYEKRMLYYHIARVKQRKEYNKNYEKQYNRKKMRKNKCVDDEY